mmetsp:Transcript_91242/g.244326  ORF Transcript_91242/g.244326 Transcript_91242/m.244326 type:complete len:327 (+) Transcript_91242:606-1586(+)
MLFECDAQPNDRDINGMHALGYAAYAGHLEVVERLVSAKSSLNLQDNQGMTALMYAAQATRFRVVRLLCELKADPNTQDLGGRDALSIVDESYATNGELRAGYEALVVFLSDMMSMAAEEPRPTADRPFAATVGPDENGSTLFPKFLVSHSVVPDAPPPILGEPLYCRERDREELTMGTFDADILAQKRSTVYVTAASAPVGDWDEVGATLPQPGSSRGGDEDAAAALGPAEEGSPEVGTQGASPTGPGVVVATASSASEVPAPAAVGATAAGASAATEPSAVGATPASGLHTAGPGASQADVELAVGTVQGTVPVAVSDSPVAAT